MEASGCGSGASQSNRCWTVEFFEVCGMPQSDIGDAANQNRLRDCGVLRKLNTVRIRGTLGSSTLLVRNDSLKWMVKFDSPGIQLQRVFLALFPTRQTSSRATTKSKLSHLQLFLLSAITRGILVANIVLKGECHDGTNDESASQHRGPSA